jgi:hypothetical protein
MQHAPSAQVVVSTNRFNLLARATGIQTNPYPAALRKFQHSCGSKRLHMWTAPVSQEDLDIV